MGPPEPAGPGWPLRPRAALRPSPVQPAHWPLQSIRARLTSWAGVADRTGWAAEPVGPWAPAGPWGRRDLRPLAARKAWRP